MDVIPINYEVVEVVFDDSRRSRLIQRHLLNGGQIRITPERVKNGAISVEHCAIIF